MSEIKIFNGTWSNPSGSTPYGYFDNDIQFITDAPKVGKSVVYRLGYPIMEVELIDIHIYSNFESAILEYSNLVNQFNIKDNLLSLQGTPITTESNYTHVNVRSNLGQYVRLSKQYEVEAGIGGDIDVKKGWIELNTETQKYNLKELWSDVYESGSSIELKKLYHYRTPASQRYFGGMNFGINATNSGNVFGTTQSGYGNQYVLPLYDDVLKMQQTEFNDEIRKAHYSFLLQNNTLTIFPKPRVAIKLWFDYILVKDRDSAFNSGSIVSGSTGNVSDISNAPYRVMEYSKINDNGKQWIREFTFALCKITLGNIRGKYESGIPSLDDNISLDGSTLRSEGISERDALIEQLKELLETSNRRNRMEARKEEAEFMMETLSYVPLMPMVG